MRDILRKDVRVYDLLVKIRRMKNNTKYKKVLREVSQIDSIRDFDRFADSVDCLVKQEVPVEYSVYGNESYYYGYSDEFVNYAGMSDTQVPLFPRMEHGIRFGQNSWTFESNALAYACQSRKRIGEIWKHDPMKPVFALGPYIHYSREYYEDTQFQALKSKLGKTLLVFPSHTAEEDCVALTESKFVDVIYQKYASHFDSVVVCAYWRDAKCQTIQEFRKRGAVIVSAGFRGDKNFIRRLKTIIMLSDAVVGDDLGTNIGFCLHMKRPYYLELVEETRTADQYFESQKKLFHQAFYTDSLGFTQQQKQLQQALYADWWGGDEAVYSPEEARCLIKLLRGIYKSAHYRTDCIPREIWKKLNKLQKDSLEYRILNNAIDGKQVSM